MELVKGQKAKVIDNIDRAHCFEIGSIVEFVKIHENHNDWFVFNGIDKFDLKSKLDQSLVEEEFELI
jgi:hypothetical protein